jgi:endoglucanase
LPRRWRLDALNDGVFTGLDPRYVRLGGGTTLVGDWDGDGFDDVGLFRADTGTFRLFVDGVLTRTVSLLDGKTGGKPLVGNWDGQGGDEIGLYRGATGVFTLDVDNDGASGDADDRVGTLDALTGGQALVGNWDGLGGDEVGVYRPDTGLFILDLDGDLASQDVDDVVMNQLAGRVGGRALVGDWDGDGTDNVGLYHVRKGSWLLDTTFGATIAEIAFSAMDGSVGGKPIVGDFDGDGDTDCGLFRTLSGRWIIDLNNNGVFNLGVDLQFTKFDGAAGGTPLVGRWQLPG